MTKPLSADANWRVHIENYEESKLRRDYGEDVRTFAEVLTENYGPEGTAWQFVKEEAAACVGQILLRASCEASSK